MTTELSTVRLVTRIAVSLTVLLSGLAFVAGLGVAAPTGATTAQSNALVDADSTNCEDCPCPEELAQKLGAQCLSVETESGTVMVAADAAESPDCVSCIVECVGDIVASGGKQITCPS